MQWYEAPDRETDVEAAEVVDPTLPEGYTLGCGWQQDDQLDELGETHFQEEHPDGRTERYGATFSDASPRWILSECLRALPDRLGAFRERLDAAP